MNILEVNILKRKEKFGQESEKPVTKKEQEKMPETADELLEQMSEETLEEITEEMATKDVAEEMVEDESREVEKLTAEMADLNQKFLRVAADFENYKRRTTSEREDLLKYSNAKLIGELLPVIDNFQLGLKNASDAPEVQSFLKGMEMIYTQLTGILEKEGLQKLDTVGSPFDPNKHEAVMQVDDDTVEEDTVVEELRAGYQFKDKVLRPAMVKVSR